MRRFEMQGTAVGLRTKAAMLVATLLLALGLAACGGGSDSGSTGSTAESAPGTAKENGGGLKQGTGGGSKNANAKQGNGSGGSGSGGVAPPKSHNDSGGGSAQFETKGGDNSIQEFGGEAGGSELDQAAAALHGFLDARAAGEWKRACENMAGGVTKSLEQLAGGAQNAPTGQGGKPKHMGCPQLLASMSAGMPAYVKKDLAQADVGALRMEGDRAFLLYHGAHDTDYFMPMAQEGGNWKVAAIAASALP